MSVPTDATADLRPGFFCSTCHQLLDADLHHQSPTICYDCRLIADIASLQAKQQLRQKERQQHQLIQENPPPVKFVTVPGQTSTLLEDDTSSIVVGAGASAANVASTTQHHTPSSVLVSSDTSSFRSSRSPTGSTTLPFLEAITSRQIPIMGAGSSCRRLGLDLISTWGLNETVTSADLFKMSHNDLVSTKTRAQLPKNFFVSAESQPAMRDRLSTLLETESALRDKFTSTTMSLCLPVFIVSTKLLKQRFLELIRANIRESVCDSARRGFCFVNYHPTTPLDNRRHLQVEFESGGPMLGAFFRIIYGAFETNWSSKGSKNIDKLTLLAMEALSIEYRPSDSHSLRVGCFKSIAATAYQAEGQWLRKYEPKVDSQGILYDTSMEPMFACATERLPITFPSTPPYVIKEEFGEIYVKPESAVPATDWFTTSTEIGTNRQPSSEHPNFALNQALFTQCNKSTPSYASARGSPKNRESHIPAPEMLKKAPPLVASPVTDGNPPVPLKYKSPCIPPSRQSVILSEMLGKALENDKADVAGASSALLDPNSSSTVSPDERENGVAPDAVTAKPPPAVSESVPDAPTALFTVAAAKSPNASVIPPMCPPVITVGLNKNNTTVQGKKRAAVQQTKHTVCTHEIYQEHTSYMREEQGGYEHLIDVNCVFCTVLVVKTARDGCIKPTRKLPVFVCIKCRGMLLCSPCYELKKTEYERSSAINSELPRASKRPARPKLP